MWPKFTLLSRALSTYSTNSTYAPHIFIGSNLVGFHHGLRTPGKGFFHYIPNILANWAYWWHEYWGMSKIYIWALVMIWAAKNLESRHHVSVIRGFEHSH